MKIGTASSKPGRPRINCRGGETIGFFDRRALRTASYPTVWARMSRPTINLRSSTGYTIFTWKVGSTNATFRQEGFSLWVVAAKLRNSCSVTLRLLAKKLAICCRAVMCRTSPPWMRVENMRATRRVSRSISWPRPAWSGRCRSAPCSRRR